MDQRSRRRLVENKREVVQRWAEEEGVRVTVLFGYLVYLEKWSGGERCLSAIGWKMFMEEAVMEMPTVSLAEATWLMERSGMGQAVYLEMRLRFKDRIYFPPVMQIRAENQLHMPMLQEYKHGVKAPLMKFLFLTMKESLQH